MWLYYAKAQIFDRLLHKACNKITYILCIFDTLCLSKGIDFIKLKDLYDNIILITKHNVERFNARCSNIYYAYVIFLR